MTTAEWISLVSLGLGGGAVVTVLKALWAHGKKHVEMDKEREAIRIRLKWGEDCFAKNDKDHSKIAHKLDLSLQGLRELLIHEGLRKPGQGINGEQE